MTPSAARAHEAEQLGRTLEPYKFVLIALLVFIVIFAVVRFPSGRPKTEHGEVSRATFTETMVYLIHNRRFLGGVFSQFVYIGAQTGIWSFTMRLALNEIPSLTDRDASNFMLISYGFFCVGRFPASYLISRFRETRVLAVYTVLAVISLIITVTFHGLFAVWMVVAVNLFLAPGYPTIYSRTLGTVEDHRHTETAGAIIVMALVGGAVFPALQGALSDATSMQFSFILPAIELFLVTLYFWSEMKYDKLTPRQKHELAINQQE